MERGERICSKCCESIPDLKGRRVSIHEYEEGKFFCDGCYEAFFQYLESGKWSRKDALDNALGKEWERGYMEIPARPDPQPDPEDEVFLDPRDEPMNPAENLFDTLPNEEDENPDQEEED